MPEDLYEKIRNFKQIRLAIYKNGRNENLPALSAASSLPTTMEIMGLVKSSLVKEAKYCTCLQITDLRHLSFFETWRAAYTEATTGTGKAVENMNERPRD
jgi:hypothetical protein